LNQEVFSRFCTPTPASSCAFLFIKEKKMEKKTYASDSATEFVKRISN
jgi:hypothetical protein